MFNISEKFPYLTRFVPRLWGGSRAVSIFFALMGLAFGIGTYLVLNRLTPIDPTPEIVWPLLSLNLFLVTGLIVLIGWQFLSLRRARRRGAAGALLHHRIVSLFALITAVPALLVAVFASVTLDRGLDSWFSERTKAIVDGTAWVGNAYLTEHRQNLQYDSLALAQGLAAFETQSQVFSYLQTQPLRGLAQALLIRRDGTIEAAAFGDRNILPDTPPQAAFEEADRTGGPAFFSPANVPDYVTPVRLLVKLQRPPLGLYLYTTRFVDSDVMHHLARTEKAIDDYDLMEARRYESQITFALVYIVLALVILLSAIWLGLAVADRLVAPVGRLMWATKQLGEGDLGARVEPDNLGDDEIGQLAKTFNTMADRIGDQQQELIAAGDTLTERANFTEMVLGGVSSGVVGINADGRINHINKAACALFGLQEADALEKPLDDIMPQLAEVTPTTPKHKISFMDDSGADHNILASASWTGDGQTRGMVITFDDLTDTLTAQRNAAWADIARRIAHEIKNPLTPIQLSAERIRSKYGKLIGEDDAIFNQCVETIIRHVEDIKRMAEEFTSFSRMPKPVLKPFDVSDIVTQSVFLQRVVTPQLPIEFDNPGALEMVGDSRLLSQALTNGLKNAAESIQADPNEKNHIDVELTRNAEEVRIAIHDTGRGWPEKNRYALLEPYNTSRPDGTGLGLSIVKKVMDDHGGKLLLEDAPWVGEGGTGASLVMVFPREEILEG